MNTQIDTTHCVLVNRTPHEIVILAPGAGASDAPIVTIPRAQRGHDARVEVTTSKGFVIKLEGGVEIETVHQRWGQIVGLSKPVPGVFQIVSAIVAAAARAAGRTTADLLVPGDQVRDHRGAIVGCRGLAEASDAMPHLAPGAEVWCTYTVEELEAMGVPRDLVVAASSPNQAGMYRIEGSTREATEAECTAWGLMARLYGVHFGSDPTPRNSGGTAQRIERFDVAELAQALLARPHRRAIASSAD